MKILTVYFSTHKHVAYAVAAAGTDAAAVSFPFITKVMYDHLPYDHATLAIAAVLLPIVPSTLLFAERSHNAEPIDDSDCSKIAVDSEKESATSKVSQDKSEDDIHNASELSPDTAVAPIEEFHEDREGFLSVSSKLYEQTTTKPSSEEPVKESEHHKLSDHLELCKKPGVLIFLLNTLLWNSGGSIMSVLAYSYYIDMGLTSQNASTGMTCYGFGALTGSVMLTIMSLRFSFNRLKLHWVLNGMLSLLLFIFPLVYYNIAMAATLGLFGFSYGTLCANLGSLSEHVNGSELLYLLYAYSMAAGGVGSFIGPIVGANLQKEFIQSAGFYFGGTCCAGALLVMILYTIYDRDYLIPHTSEKNGAMVKKTDNPDLLVAQSNLSLAAYL